MAKVFKKVAAQGELLFIRLPDDTPVPRDAELVKPINGKVIVGHSETDHFHVVSPEKSDLYQLPNDILECLLVVRDPDELTHLREFDQHEPIRFEPGKYRVRKLREYTPEGWRRQQD